MCRYVCGHIYIYIYVCICISVCVCACTSMCARNFLETVMVEVASLRQQSLHPLGLVSTVLCQIRQNPVQGPTAAPLTEFLDAPARDCPITFIRLERVHGVRLAVYLLLRATSVLHDKEA